MLEVSRTRVPIIQPTELFIIIGSDLFGSYVTRRGVPVGIKISAGCRQVRRVCYSRSLSAVKTRNSFFFLIYIYVAVKVKNLANLILAGTNGSYN